MSRKGKGAGTSKGKQSAPAIKSGKGKGDDKQAAVKELGKIEEKVDALLASLENEELDELLGENLEEELEKNNNLPQAEAIMEREIEGCDDDDEDLGYHA